MSRSLALVIVLLAPLALLGACIEVAPRSSVAFQNPAEREVRYAAEVALAIKEDRRDAVSEAAANGRVVLPQMPEIWAVSPAQGPPDAASAEELALLEPEIPDLGAVGLASSCDEARADPGDAGPCPSGLPATGPALPALPPAAIAPAAAPLRAGAEALRQVHRYRLHFERDSAQLDARARKILESAIGSARLLRPRRIVVGGSAARAEVDADQHSLSSRRAALVVDALVRAGLPAERIETTTLGAATQPADGRDGGQVEIALR